MISASFDRFLYRDSPIHRLDARVKVLGTVLFILSNALLPDGAWLAFVLAGLLVIVVAQLAQLGVWFAIKRSFVALPFALAAVTVLFTIPGRPLLTLSLGPWQPAISDAGLLRFTSILIRSFLSVQMAILLTAVTPFPDLIHALRHLRVSQPIVTIISFMYRYLFVLADEAGRLLRAREARSARLGTKGGGTLAWRARVVGHMAGQLFLRSYERSHRVYQAMLARGYGGHLLTMNPHVMTPPDWLALLFMFLWLAAVQLVGITF
ncbi:MAG: cobalt ECF transporter T component CbiQ [Anaerolineae bacterium]